MQLAAELDRGLRARSSGRSPRQKWAQMRAAFALEAGWNKHRILETYLNLVSFRGELQGIAAASRGLFGKTPAGLDAAESWLLAALLGAPNPTADRVARRACRLAGAAGDPGVCHHLATLAQTALHRADLVHFDENGIGDTALDTFTQERGVSDEQVVADKLNVAA